MGIFARISDIVTANLNDLTEGFENPEQLLKQAVREMEESIADATHATAKALAHEKVLRNELNANRDQATRWSERAQQAVTAGDDELARKALKRKLEHDKLVAAIDDQLTAAQSAAGALRRQLEAMKAKLAEAKRNLATLSARQRAADFRKKMDAVGGVTTDLDQDAFAKFDRLRSRVEQAEAEAEALAELRGGCTAEEIAEDELGSHDAAIEAELEQLKRPR
jgi:phage shock protein A